MTNAITQSVRDNRGILDEVCDDVAIAPEKMIITLRRERRDVTIVRQMKKRTAVLEFGRQVAVDLEPDADLDKRRSGPGHGLLLYKRARPPVTNQRPNLPFGSTPRNGRHVAGSAIHAPCFT